MWWEREGNDCDLVARTCAVCFRLLSLNEAVSDFTVGFSREEEGTPFFGPAILTVKLAILYYFVSLEIWSPVTLSRRPVDNAV